MKKLSKKKSSTAENRKAMDVLFEAYISCLLEIANRKRNKGNR